MGTRPARFISSAAVCALAALLMVGVAWGLDRALAAGSGSPSPGASGKIVLRLGWTSEPDNLNPFIGYQSSDYEIYHLNYDLLTGYDPATLQPRPELAASWSHSADGLVWTFKLQHDVTWQDGVPFTAADVAFTYNYIIKNQLSAFSGYTDGIDKVVVIDPYTVEMRCSRPKANILGMWVPIVPAHIWSKVPAKAAETTYQNKLPIVGTGPFQVVAWKKGSYIQLDANPDYWKGRPHIDEVLFESYTNANTLTLDMRSGTLDGAWGVPPAQLRELAATPGVKATSYFAVGFDELTFNCASGSSGNPVLRDPLFRQALNWAIDKEAIAKIAYGGYVRPATSVVPSGMYDPSLDYHWQPPAAEAYGFDLDKARQLLDAAGYKDTNGDGVREYNGKPITLGLYARAEQLSSQSSCKLMAGWFKQVGLKIDLQVISEEALSAKVWSTAHGKTVPNYDMFQWGWVGDIDPNFTMSILTGSQIGGWNQAYWSDPQYDRLFEQQTRELDPQKRKAIVWQMEQLIYDQSPFIPLVYMQDLEAWNVSRWDGWVLSPSANGGAWYTYQTDSYLNVRPKSASASAAAGSHGWLIALIVAAAVVVGVVAWLALRGRGKRAEES